MARSIATNTTAELAELLDFVRPRGEQPDWEEYLAAMRIQTKSLIRITATRWGPIATGGFPADVAARLDRELQMTSAALVAP